MEHQTAMGLNEEVPAGRHLDRGRGRQEKLDEMLFVFVKIVSKNVFMEVKFEVKFLNISCCVQTFAKRVVKGVICKIKSRIQSILRSQDILVAAVMFGCSD